MQFYEGAIIMSQTYTTLSAGLTAVFTPPASCSSSWTYEAETFNGISGGLLVQNALTNFDTSCWPASFTANGRANGRAPSPIQLYSPGICPQWLHNCRGFNPEWNDQCILLFAVGEPHYMDCTASLIRAQKLCVPY